VVDVAGFCVLPGVLARNAVVVLRADHRQAGYVQIAGSPGRHEPGAGPMGFGPLHSRGFKSYLPGTE